MAEKEVFSKEELRRRLDGHELDLSLCTIAKVPVKQILNLPVVKVLDLSCNQIFEIPDAFCDLVGLTQIDLSKNCLVSLPLNFGNLKNLKRLDLYSNNLVSLPLSFCELKLLKWLDLKDNPVQTDLYDIVGDCLEPKDCESCAKKILNFMRVMKSEDDKRKAKEAEMERKRKLKEESEMAQQTELRKREKKMEKEKRRQAYLEQQKNKPEVCREENNELHSDKSKESNGKISSHAKASGQTRNIFVNLFKVLLVGLVMVLVFFIYQQYAVTQ